MNLNVSTFRPARIPRSAPIFLLLFGVFTLIAQAQRPARSGPAESFASLSSKADSARDADRLDEAVSIYRRALAMRPSWAEGWWSLATIQYDRDAYDKAAPAFKNFITLHPEDGTAHAMLGLCEFQLGHEHSALQQIQQGKKLGLQKNPELWHVVLYHESVLLQRKGSFQAAQDALEELCLEVGPSDGAAKVLGMTMLRNSAKEFPAESADGNITLGVGRAQCLAGQKKYDEARPLFEDVVRQNPNYPNIHYAFGLFLLEARDLAAAVEQLKLEITNHPENVIARMRIAAAEYKQDSGAGIPYAEEAVRLDPQQPLAHYLLGLLRLDVDDYRGAIPELEIAKKGLPQEPKIYAALGTAYSRGGQRQAAARARAIFARLNQQKEKSVDQSEETTGTGDARIPGSDPVSSRQ